MSPVRVPTCVWRVTPALLIALDERFGEPVDTYVNGSQVWLRDDGPDEVVFEWRLHPVAGYRRPDGLETEAVFSTVALALAMGDQPPAPLDRLWDGLECFPAYGADIEPSTLAASAGGALGVAPDAYGLVDHEVIAAEWEKARGAIEHRRRATAAAVELVGRAARHGDVRGSSKIHVNGFAIDGGERRCTPPFETDEGLRELVASEPADVTCLERVGRSSPPSARQWNTSEYNGTRVN